MNRLFIVVLISLSTLLFACSDESSSNSSEGADRANDSSVVDDNDAGDDMDEDTGDDMDEDADGAPSGGGAVSAPSGGGLLAHQVAVVLETLAMRSTLATKQFNRI